MPNTVLLVTADPAVTENVARILADDAEARVEFARTGRAALDRLEQGNVGLVLYDAALTLEDGIDGILEIKARFPLLPIIPVTAARRSE
ncbi:MAG: response regulator [Armatimonadetes bacterium]|nr:response regulator [Armatimonadota bacterium]